MGAHSHKEKGRDQITYGLKGYDEELDFILSIIGNLGWFKTGQGHNILCFSEYHVGCCVENTGWLSELMGKRGRRLGLGGSRGNREQRMDLG